jgi:hypothetical protein
MNPDENCAAVIPWLVGFGIATGLLLMLAANLRLRYTGRPTKALKSTRP